MEELLLCIIGMPGSGKTSVSNTIKNNFKACIFSTGDIIREEIKRRGLKYTKENDRKISKWFHSSREELLIKRLCNKIKKCKDKIIVIEGLRSSKEPKLIEKHMKKPIIIAVKIGFQKRYERLVKRKRFKELTKDYLKKRDKRETKYGLDKLIEKADYKISNTGSLKDLERKTIKLMKSIKQ